jgi:hypothetical protein
VSPSDREARRDLGVELLAAAEDEELAVAEAVDRVEAVTTDPRLVREVLDAAERRGVVERDGAVLRVRRGGGVVRVESEVVERPVDADCRRCGASLSTGHFVRFDAGELGPFGSSCVRKVVGRD